MAVSEQPPTGGIGPDHDEGGGLWLDEPAGTPIPERSVARRVLSLVALAAVLALVAVPVGLALAGGSRPASHRVLPAPSTSDASTPVSLGDGPAEHQVLSALSATTDSGSFDLSYTLQGQPGHPTTTSTECATVYAGVGAPVGVLSNGPVAPAPTDSKGGAPATQRCFPVQENESTRVTGNGTIDVAPKAMVVSASIANGAGAPNLDVSVRLDDQDVWESGGADYGLVPAGGSSGGVVPSGGEPLSGFASLVQSTLGTRTGAVAMIGMASPAGYLDLEQESVTGAAEIGPGAVDGTPVTFYEVAVDPARIETMPGLSADEITTIKAAVSVLQGEGYSGTTVKVGIDGAGFIRQATSTAHFADGGTVTLDATFTKFGCAGTVLMPGQAAAGSTTQACSSDTPTTTATPSTTTGPVPSSTTVPPTSTSTDGPPSTAPTTTGGAGGSVPPSTPSTAPGVGNG